MDNLQRHFSPHQQEATLLASGGGLESKIPQAIGQVVRTKKLEGLHGFIKGGLSLAVEQPVERATHG